MDMPTEHAKQHTEATNELTMKSAPDGKQAGGDLGQWEAEVNETETKADELASRVKEVKPLMQVPAFAKKATSEYAEIKQVLAETRREVAEDSTEIGEERKKQGMAEAERAKVGRQGREG